MGRALIDLTGQKFGEWTVINYVGNKKWRCKCSCGEIKEVSGYDLRCSKSISCGHNSNKKVDITGKTFGHWKVIRFSGNRQWECMCTACGVVKDVAYGNLVNGLSKSCGCVHRVKDDIIGSRFGYLRVIRKTNDTKYLCICDCGKEVEVYRSNLLKKSGGTRSCGCKFYENGANTRQINGNTQIRDDWQIDVLKCRDNLVKYILSMKYRPTVIELSKILNISESQIRNKIDTYKLGELVKYDKHTSEYEKDIVKFLESICDREIIPGDRSILNGKELDIYIPDLSIAIEFNGNYWHSGIMKDKYYHQRKTIDCLKNKIHLIHVFEYEWINENEQITKYLMDVVSGNYIVNTNDNIVTCHLDKESPFWYINAGYELIEITEPNYVWWSRDGVIKCNNTDALLSDTQMEMSGYTRIYDSGNAILRRVT